jgi:hypothetical protein
MKKNLRRVEKKMYHFDGVKIEGKNNYMSGDCSGLRGEYSGLWINWPLQQIAWRLRQIERGKSLLKRNKCYTHRSIRMRK